MPLVFNCPKCREWAVGNSVWGANISDQQFQVRQCSACGQYAFGIAPVDDTDKFKLLYPEARLTAPDDYPPLVADNFSEALRSLSAGAFKASAAMTRSAIQAAMVVEQAQGKDLFHQIEDLANTHIIPQTLSDWAHEIRDGGNTAVHPELGQKVDRSDAEELVALAESIFEYLYIIPAEVNRRRLRRSSQP